MKTLIISYTFSGNNLVLANGIASQTGADHVQLKERKKRKLVTIIFDVVFGRTPKIQPLDKKIEDYENLVFVAPIWLGKVATPLRTVFKSMNGSVKSYSFISLSAGADGKRNPVERELFKRTGKKPQTIINPIIRDLLPADPEPSRKELDAYRLKGDESKSVIDEVVAELKKTKTINQ